MKHQRNFRGENNVAARLSPDTKTIEQEREFALWKLALGPDEIARIGILPEENFKERTHHHVGLMLHNL